MKGYLNGGYFPERTTPGWLSAWASARTLAKKNRVLQQYGYVDLHKTPGYRSSLDYFSDSYVNEVTIGNIRHVGSQIHASLRETKSYENLYYCSAETEVSYYIQWSTSEDDFKRRYPFQYNEVKRCLDGVHSGVRSYLGNNQEMALEIQKLKIITYLANFLRTLKGHNLIPLLAEESKAVVYSSPDFLPKVLGQQPQADGTISFSIGGGIGMNANRSIQNRSWNDISNFHSTTINAMNEIPINTVKKIFDPLNNVGLNILHIAVMRSTRTNDDYNWLSAIE
jgi:hypothetical protein